MCISEFLSSGLKYKYEFIYRKNGSTMLIISAFLIFMSIFLRGKKTAEIKLMVSQEFIDKKMSSF